MILPMRSQRIKYVGVRSMDLWEAIKSRHSVRNYTDRKIEGDVKEQLIQMVNVCNRESGLHIQLCLNEPRAFSGMMAKYGKFKNVNNYIALVGRKEKGLEEKCGYYGEKIVLKAQQLGLNTCWVALTYSKGKSTAVVEKGEKFLMVIAIGYGETSGAAHKGKPIEDLCRVKGVMPDWFRRGIEAAQLAPTAINQQKFLFELNGNTVKATSLFGPNSRVDLGIVKYHFEIGTSGGNWHWE